MVAVSVHLWGWHEFGAAGVAVPTELTQSQSILCQIKVMEEVEIQEELGGAPK